MDLRVYVDGSFNVGESVTHSGLAVVETHGEVVNLIHVATSIPELVAMHNDGGELFASIYACSVVPNSYSMDKSDTLTVYYDYTGIGNFIGKGPVKWAAKKPGAQIYVALMSKYLKEAPCQIKFIKVKAHSGNVYNNLADRAANNECPSGFEHVWSDGGMIR